MFSYYGGKHKAAGRYPEPKHQTIVEPFAGSAGYSHRYWWHDVVLVDLDPNIVAAWQWLIAAGYADVMSLPILGHGDHIDDFGLDRGAAAVVGWWINRGTASPCKTPAKWCRESNGESVIHWGQACRQRLADNVHRCDHWTIIDGMYEDAPDIEATWFVDPPYNNNAGSRYKCGPKCIDYTHLADWCKSRRGQVVVCENYGATWLPFSKLYDHVGTVRRGGKGKKSVEAIWTNE